MLKTGFRQLASGVIAAALGLGLLAATAGEAAAGEREEWYAYCSVTDFSSKKEYYSPMFRRDIYKDGADEEFDLQKKDFLRQVSSSYPLGDIGGPYCFTYQTKAEYDARIAEERANHKDRVFVTLPSPPGTRAAGGAPTAFDAQQFLKETLTNGVSRVHPMTATNEMVSQGRAIARVSASRCSTTITYIGDWFGRAVEETLTVDWTRSVDVKPFYTDPARSHVAALVAVQQTSTVGTVESIPGFVIDTGSESMEPRVTKALQTIVAECRPASSHGF